MSKQSAFFYILLFTLTIGGCGGGSASGGAAPNAAPVISNLRYTPTSATYIVSQGNTTTQVTGTIEYRDADGIEDISAIIVSIPNAADIEIPISQMTVSGADISASFNVSITSPAVTTFSVRARDNAGNVSNTLQNTFTTNYVTTVGATFSQNVAKTNFQISFTGGTLPSCAKKIDTSYTITSTTTKVSNHGCLVLDSFTADMADGTPTSWVSNLAHIALCSGPQVPSTTLGGSVDLTNGSFTWNDSSTESVYSMSLPSLMDAEVHCI